MNPFNYERASDASSAVALLSQAPGGAFLGGGTNLVDLMKLGVARPDLLVDVTHLPYRPHRSASRWRCPHRGDGAQQRTGCRSHDSHALSCARAGAARGRLRPAAQPCHDRGKPASAHALRLFPGCLQAVQQTRAGQRLPRARGLSP